MCCPWVHLTDAIAQRQQLVRGLDRSITGEIQSIGANHLYIRKWGGRIVAGEREFLRLAHNSGYNR